MPLPCFTLLRPAPSHPTLLLLLHLSHPVLCCAVLYEQKSTEVLKAAVGLLGDLGQIFGSRMAQIYQMPFVRAVRTHTHDTCTHTHTHTHAHCESSIRLHHHNLGMRLGISHTIILLILLRDSSVQYLHPPLIPLSLHPIM